MGISRRSKRSYFYESKRVDGKVVNRLVAKGLAAEFLARCSSLERSERADRAAEARDCRSTRRGRRSEWQAERRSLDGEEIPLIEATAWALGLAEAALVAAGYAKRYGHWRRPRVTAMSEGDPKGKRPATTSGKEAEPSPLGDGFDAHLGTEPVVEIKAVGGELKVEVAELKPDDRESRVRRYNLHLQKAARFEPSELPAVRRAFAEYAKVPLDPEKKGPGGEPRTFLATMIEAHGGNPTARAEDALIRRSASLWNGGLYGEEALRRSLAEFKAKLLGDGSSPLERVMVDSIGLAWLSVMESQERSARATRGKPALLDYMDKRLERAGRRLNSALKTLDTIRRKGIPSVAVQVNLTGSEGRHSLDVPGESEWHEGEDIR